jgi:hypothetical protein
MDGTISESAPHATPYLLATSFQAMLSLAEYSRETYMMRRGIVNLMLFVLLWTSTFLHDLAEPDQPVAVQSASAAIAFALSTPTENQSFEGHYHDALIGSKFNSAAVPLQASQFLPLAANSPFVGSLQILGGSSLQRGPPIARAFAKPRLHLIKRVLLI